MKKNYLQGLFAFAINLIRLTALSGETCEERRATTGTLFSTADADTTANLDDAGYVATFNGLPLPLLDNTEIPVGSTYEFEISHSNPEMQGLLEFELDWSSMVHNYEYDSLETTINGTLRVIGENTLRVVVGVTTTSGACNTYTSNRHVFQVVPTADTLTLDDAGTNHACNICGVPNAQASSSSLVLHPDYAQERPCQEWQEFGLQGRLTPAACQFILQDPGLAAICGCRHGGGTGDASGGKSMAWTSRWMLMTMTMTIMGFAS